MIFLGEKSPLWSCDMVNAQVILRIKHKETLKMKVLFPSLVISMYLKKAFFPYLMAPYGANLFKKCSLTLILNPNLTYLDLLKCHLLSFTIGTRPNLYLYKGKSDFFNQINVFSSFVSSIITFLLWNWFLIQKGVYKLYRMRLVLNWLTAIGLTNESTLSIWYRIAANQIQSLTVPFFQYCVGPTFLIWLVDAKWIPQRAVSQYRAGASVQVQSTHCEREV